MAVHRDLTHVEQIEAAAEEIANCALGWIEQCQRDGRTDWDDLLGKVENELDANLPAEYGSSAMNAVQRIIRRAWKEAQS